MITYVCLGTNDLARATKFYDATLAALGLNRCETGDPEWDATTSGWGTYGGTHMESSVREIALWVSKPFNELPATAGNGTMVALIARSWKEVDDFHAAALANGGRSEGGPGLRPQYNPDFYATYVRDPDGNKLSAVCRGFTQPQ